MSSVALVQITSQNQWCVYQSTTVMVTLKRSLVWLLPLTRSAANRESPPPLHVHKYFSLPHFTSIFQICNFISFSFFPPPPPPLALSLPHSIFLPFFFLLSLFSFFLLRFGIKDSETMKFILRFSSFMLSSTLAFQHEMSLKNQNQALLQVAKTLFTSLGVWGWWCVGNCLCGWVGMNVLALFLSAQINPKCCCVQWWQRPKT